MRTLTPREPGEGLGAMQNRDAPPQGLLILGVVEPQGSRHHEGLRVADVSCVVADRDRDAAPPEGVDRSGLRAVGPRDRVPAVVEHAGDTTHAGAPDAHEVKAAESLGQRLGEVRLDHRSSPYAG